MVEGAVIAIVFLLVGRFLPGRRRAPKPPQPIEPVCGCGHHHSFHDPETGQCNGIDRRIKFDDAGYDRGYRDHPCTCQVYSGPTPLPQYYAPEVSS